MQTNTYQIYSQII